MDKKGELTSAQLTTIILAIIGFILAGLVLYNVFEDESLTNRDLCRLSVLSRATVPTAGQQFVPLNCQTEKICITTEGGGFLGFGGKNNSCKQFAGEKNIRTVEVKVDGSINDLKAVETIQREVANAMYDCWLMTGEGKMDIFPPGEDVGTAWSVLEQLGASIELNALAVKPSCIVCSRVAFSDALYEADKKYNFMKNINYNNFMSTQVVGNTGKTYTSLFTSGSGSGYGSIAQKEATEPRPLGINPPNASSHLSIVFAQIKVSGETPEDAFWTSLQTGGIMGGVAAVSSPGGLLSLPAWLIKILAVGAVSTSLAYDAETTTRENQALSAATCGQFESTSDGQKGCSLVKLMDWNVTNINSLCYNIEGNL